MKKDSFTKFNKLLVKLVTREAQMYQGNLEKINKWEEFTIPNIKTYYEE